MNTLLELISKLPIVFIAGILVVVVIVVVVIVVDVVINPSEISKKYFYQTS